MKNFIAHVDVDAFYCACHCLFEPALIGKPLLVLSNNDTTVVAVSRAGKALGISRGMPLFHLRGAIQTHHIALRSSAYSLYGTLSQRLMEILELHTLDVEPYSIDEAFIRLTTPFNGLKEKMQALRAKIMRWTGLTVSIGIVPTRALAKRATRLAKHDPDGVFCLSPIASERESILAGCPTQEIWGIGPASANRLGYTGIRSALQLAQAPDQLIRHILHLPGLRLAYELRGVPAFPLKLIPAPPHSIHRSQSFGHPIAALSDLKEALASHIGHATEHLRAHELAATVLSVSLSTNRFHPGPHYARQMTTTLARPSCSTFEFLRAANTCLEQLFRDGYSYHKVGVLLADFVAAPPQPLSLWEPPASVWRQTRLLSTVDSINDRYGSNTIRIGMASLHPLWARRIAYPSPAYTSRWNELALVSP